MRRIRVLNKLLENPLPLLGCITDKRTLVYGCMYRFAHTLQPSQERMYARSETSSSMDEGAPNFPFVSTPSGNLKLNPHQVSKWRSDASMNSHQYSTFYVINFEIMLLTVQGRWPTSVLCNNLINLIKLVKEIIEFLQVAKVYLGWMRGILCYATF